MMSNPQMYPVPIYVGGARLSVSTSIHSIPNTTEVKWYGKMSFLVVLFLCDSLNSQS